MYVMPCRSTVVHQCFLRQKEQRLWKKPSGPPAVGQKRTRILDNSKQYQKLLEMYFLEKVTFVTVFASHVEI